MLTDLYIEALLVDEELADLVWEVWDAGAIDDKAARSDRLGGHPLIVDFSPLKFLRSLHK